MPTSDNLGTIEFGGPAIYRVRVQGELSDVSRRRFAGMNIECIHNDEDSPSTILAGLMRDQAELRGVLDALYGLRLPVISVERCGDDGDGDKGI